MDLGLDLGVKPLLVLLLGNLQPLIHLSPKPGFYISQLGRSASRRRGRGAIFRLIEKQSRSLTTETVDAALSGPTYCLQEHLSLLGLG